MKKSLVGVVLLLVVGCGGRGSWGTTSEASQLPTTTVTVPSTTTTSLADTTTTAPATTTTSSPVVPLDPSTSLEPIAVIDTGPLTLAELALVESPDLDGYVNLRIGVSPGEYGSYALAVPWGWLWWVLGEDPEGVVTVAADKDPAFAQIIDQALTQSNDAMDPDDGRIAVYRGEFIDPEVPFLLTGSVALNDGSDLDLDGLVEEVRSQYEGLGGEILRLEQFPAEGGGSVEFTLRLDLPSQGWADVIIQHQSFVLDEQNEWLWGVVCTVHQSGAAESDEACWTMLRSFVPFGPLVDG